MDWGGGNGVRSRGEGRKKGLWAPVRPNVDLVIYLVEGCEQKGHGDEHMLWLLLISFWNLRDFMFSPCGGFGSIE